MGPPCLFRVGRLNGFERRRMGQSEVLQLDEGYRSQKGGGVRQLLSDLGDIGTGDLTTNEYKYIQDPVC